MKKKLILLSAVISMSLFFPFKARATNAAAGEQPNLQMAVMSDVHMNKGNPSTKFEQALRDLKIAAPGYNTIAVVGDLTDNGIEGDYQAFNEILATYKNPTAEELLSMGNHEYFDSSVTDETLKQRFMDNNGDHPSSIYSDKWIKGYHFISLAGEQSPKTLAPLANTYPGAKDWAYISENQYQWLEDTLAVNADSNKPIFVFLHQPIADTVYGSIRWNAGFDSHRLLAILQHYPQAILFSGHSHYLLNHPKSIYQDGFTMVNTSSVEYTWYEGGWVPTLSQGYIVNVYNNRVELKAREFSSGTWIRTATIPIPFKEAAKDNTKPSFAGNSGLAASEIEPTSAMLSWDQGRDNTIIDRYIVKDADKVIQTVYSHYWEPDVKVTAVIGHLFPNTTYTYEVYAVDAWDNVSLNPIKAAFTTKSVKGWYQQDGTWYYFGNEGKKLTGWLFDKNHWFYFNPSGVMQTGWQWINGKWYCFNKMGEMRTGWLQEGSAWYFLDANGAMKTGWLFDGNGWYFLDTQGVMKTGWILSKNNWYFMNSKGVMQTGWLAQGAQWYYLKPDGTMAVNWYFISGKWYYFSAYGVWVK